MTRKSVTRDDILTAFLGVLIIVVAVGGVLWIRDISLTARNDERLRKNNVSYCVDLDYVSVLYAFDRDWCVEIVDGKLRGVEVHLQ